MFFSVTKEANRHTKHLNFQVTHPHAEESTIPICRDFQVAKIDELLDMQYLGVLTRYHYSIFLLKTQKGFQTNRSIVNAKKTKS